MVLFYSQATAGRRGTASFKNQLKIELTIHSTFLVTGGGCLHHVRQKFPFHRQCLYLVTIFRPTACIMSQAQGQDLISVNVLYGRKKYFLLILVENSQGKLIPRHSLTASRALSRHSLTALRALSGHSLTASRALSWSAKIP